MLHLLNLSGLQSPVCEVKTVPPWVAINHYNDFLLYLFNIYIFGSVVKNLPVIAGDMDSIPG